MKQVNDATKNTLENFRRKATELPFSAHPYNGMKEGLKRLGKTEWDEEHKKSALGALVMWVMGIVGNSAATTLNEIVALMNIAVATEDDENKKAADEMASSCRSSKACSAALWARLILSTSQNSCSKTDSRSRKSGQRRRPLPKPRRQK